MSTECEHMFEPRYDEGEKVDHEALDIALKYLKEQKGCTLNVNMFKDKKYVCDICVKCGMKINR